MDFNLDDPLEDILSDSSNNSFFDAKIKETRAVKAKSITPDGTAIRTHASTAKIGDLFNIKNTKSSEQNPTISAMETVMGSSNKSQRISTAEGPMVIKSPSVSNDDDVISGLGFDPRISKTAKINILEDLFGPLEVRKSAKNVGSGPVTVGSVQQKDKVKVISRQAIDTTEDTVPATYIGPPRTKAAYKQSITSLNGPLEFFNAPITHKAMNSCDLKGYKQTPKSREKPRNTDWLGLEIDNKHEREAQNTSETIKSQTQILNLEVPKPVMGTVPAALENPIAENAHLMASLNLEAQTTLQALEQQESQLLLATQMKSQEQVLLEMQRKQKELLAQQELKFNELLQKQITRQRQLESTIRLQQDRINAHIELLMAQPTLSLPPITKIVEDKTGNFKKHSEAYSEMSEVQLRADVKRLEFDKLRLEDVLSNISANHEKEVEFLENSHKKQIKVLEENLENLESRLKNDSKRMEESYVKKVGFLGRERSEIIKTYEEKLENAEQNYDTAIKKLRTDYDAEIRTLKEEHKNMINNIRQSKLLEFSVTQENNSYLDTLRGASSHLESVTGDIQTLREELCSKMDYVHKEREMKLEEREKKVGDIERRLEFTTESSEVERKRLMELVQTMETQLSKLSRESSEEQWALRQKMTSLEAERNSFEREREFARETLAREEKQIQELKQFHLEEKQRYLQQIQDERQLLTTEKTKFEMVQKLRASSDTQTSRIEVETALKVAQAATRQADQERERYFTMQKQLESKRRDIIEQENNLRIKQDELDSCITWIKEKKRQIKETLQRYRLGEQNLNTKVQLFQGQMRQLAEREERLSEDRLQLSQDRIDIQNSKQKLNETKCSLCRIGEESVGISQFSIRKDRQKDIYAKNTEILNFVAKDNGPSHFENFLDDDIMQSLKRMENTCFTRSSSAELDLGDLYNGDIITIVPTNQSNVINLSNNDIKFNGENLKFVE